MNLALGNREFCSAGAITDNGHWVYVHRREFDLAWNCVETSKGVSIQGARQVGKTTTLLHLEERAKSRGAATSNLNLGEFFGDTLDQLLAWVVAGLLGELPSNVNPAEIDVKATDLKGLLRSVLHIRAAAGCEVPWVVLMDEVDAVARLTASDVMHFLMLWRAELEFAQGRLKLVTASVYSLDVLFADANDTGISLNNLPELRLPFWSRNDVATLDALAKGFDDTISSDAVRQVLNEVIDATGGHPGLLSTLCNHLKWLSKPQDPRPLRQLWLSLRERLVSPDGLGNGPDPLAGYIGSLQTQLLALGREFWACRSILQRVMRGETSGHWNQLTVARLVHMGLLRVDSNQVPGWAADLLAYRLDSRWLDAIEERLTSQLGESISEPARIAVSSERKVLLLTMGGTIGMAKGADGRVSFQGKKLLPAVRKIALAGGSAEITVEELVQLDGINVTPEEWLLLARRIHAERDNFQAFIVTHGTDTMTYTASALAYMLGPAFDRPVIFTGAQTTLDVEWGDTRANLARAVLAATVENAIPEVQIVFGDQVLRATRAVKLDDRLFQAFGSPAAEPLARITEVFLRAESWQRLPVPEAGYEFLPFKADEILFISLAPGVAPQQWRAAVEAAELAGQPVQGIIITTPGAGSLPSQGRYNFTPFIKWAVDRRIPVLILGQMPINALALQQYQVSSAGTLAGGIPAGNMSLSAAYTKFSWAIGRACNEEKHGQAVAENYMMRVKDLMLTPYVGEQDDLNTKKRNPSTSPVSDYRPTEQSHE